MSLCPVLGRAEQIAVVSRLALPAAALSTIPDPHVDNEAEYESAISDLPLHRSLYAASFIPPQKVWASRALDWCIQGPDDAKISAWISRALASGAWDTTDWFKALGNQENGRLRDIFAQWGALDLEVSQVDTV